jgi:Uncharacterized protein conserved in bacteria
MTYSIRTGLALAATLAIVATGASAQGWTPPGPITLKIAFAAGGGADTQARLIATELETRYGWTIIPENVTGRGGLTALADLMDDPADGTVISMIASETLGYTMLAAELPWTPADFTPIATTAAFQMGLVAASSSGWTNVGDMLEAARGGQTIRFGAITAKLGDLAYLLAETNGLEFNIVDVDGGAAVLNGLMAGDLDVGFVAGAQARGVASGDLVNLASAMTSPLTQTPDAPLLSEYGLGYDSDGYFMFVAPAGLPAEVRSALAEAIASVATDPSNPAGEAIVRGFGSATVLQGEVLDTFMQNQFDAAGALLAAAN